MKRILLGLSIFLALLLPTTATVLAASPFDDATNQVKTGVCLDGTTTCNSSSAAGLNIRLIAGIQLFSAIVGLIAVIMIVIAGLRYITSGGESSKVAGAKDAIIYAVIGLIIVAFAQLIVHFVLKRFAV